MTRLPEPGAWQTETRNGVTRRFRWIGSVKEYETDFTFTGGTTSQPQPEIKKQPKKCPFIEGIKTDCDPQCAAFFGGYCTLGRTGKARDTIGRRCPVSKYHYPCREDCAVYRGGCTLMTTPTESEDRQP